MFGVLAAALMAVATLAVPHPAGSRATPDACARPSEDVGQPWTDGPSAAAQELAPGVRAVVYPGPAETGDPWSQWGQGLVLPDGRFLSAVGDHRGPDGNSYLYEYEPGTGTLTLISDVLSLVDHQPESWGYGKIHAPLVAGPCGEVYAMTYWGTRRDLVYGDGYTGDRLLRLDPDQRSITDLGVPAEGYGVPSMVGDDTTLYLEAVLPASDPDAGALVAYDVDSGVSTVVDADPTHVGFRAMAVDADGGVLFTEPAGRLARYDPSSGEIVELATPLPGQMLRAATGPAPDGTVYGVTQGPEVFIAVRPDGTIDDLGPAPGYVASLAMTPDGSTVLFVPGAHGDGWRDGTPLMALDTATGEQRRVLDLNPLTEAGLGLTAGGTYDLALDADANRLLVGLNAGPVATREDTTFGQVVLIDIDLTALAPEPTVSVGSTPSVAGAVAPVCAALERGDDGPNWLDATDDAGLGGLTGMMGHAAAWGDVDGDGAPDLFVGTFADRPSEEYQVRGAAGPSPDHLLVQRDGVFTSSEVGFAPGRTSGAALVDLDGDGDVDLVVSRNVEPNAVTASAPTEIWRNDDGTFSLVADSGLDPASPGRSVGVADLDTDGMLDLVVVEDRWRGGRSRLYRNLGDLRFEEHTDGWQWPGDVTGLGIATGDLDGDGRTDLVVGGSNRVFLGTGAGVSEVTDAIAPWTFPGDEDDAAGVALGDVDGDGDSDVVIGQHFNSTIDTDATAPVRLYRNDTTAPGALVLTEITDAAGLIGLPTKAPHVALVDLDNDGRLDLLTSASADDGTSPSVFMATEPSADGTPRFEPPTGLGDDHYWVTGPTADVDGDGRLDVFLTEWDPALPSRLLLNRRPAGHALEVRVGPELGGGPGTVVAGYEPGRAGEGDGLVARAEITVGQGAFGGIAPVAHLGLGQHPTVDVVVTPPAPAEPITITGVTADQVVGVPGC